MRLCESVCVTLSHTLSQAYMQYYCITYLTQTHTNTHLQMIAMTWQIDKTSLPAINTPISPTSAKHLSLYKFLNLIFCRRTEVNIYKLTISQIGLNKTIFHKPFIVPIIWSQFNDWKWKVQKSEIAIVELLSCALQWWQRRLQRGPRLSITRSCTFCTLLAWPQPNCWEERLTLIHLLTDKKKTKKNSRQSVPHTANSD